MNDMTPTEPFELRLAGLLGTYAQTVVHPFDSLEIARSTKAASAQGGILARWRPTLFDRRLAWLLVTAGLLVVGTAIAVVGGGPAKLTRAPEQLVYTRGDGLFVANADGTGERRIASEGSFGDTVAWSPSHRYIAHRAWRASPTGGGDFSQIVIRTADGQETARLEPGGYFSWSPAEDILVRWSLNDHDGNTLPEREWAFTLHRPDGSLIRRIPHTIDMAWVSGWSPDGTKMLVAGCRLGDIGSAACSSGVGRRVWVVESDGSAITQLPIGLDPASDTPFHVVGSASWSPDGTRIALSECEATGNGECHSQLRVIAVDGSESRVIAGGTMIPGRPQSVDSPILWSPDSRRIAFGLYDAAANQADTYVMDPDGTTPRLTTLGAMPLAWSRDSRSLLYTQTGPDEAIETWVMNADGSDQHRVLSGTTSLPDW